MIKANAITRIEGEVSAIRPFLEMGFEDSSVLWMINKEVFHPRGYCLALIRLGDEIVGWSIYGDGVEPWSFSDELDETKCKEKFEQTLRESPPTPEPFREGADN